ncbi:MAG TPA: flavin reductase family protein [Ktedonobacterales bacterium]|jgi:flavin reductase (DIM6/NTAB) family NADH-FMN oxidoreductase RutF
MAITPETFKALLAHLAGAVTIITTRGADGQIWGFTASSVCSVSLEPPLVLFCLEHTADCHPAFLESSVFAINFLSSEQSGLSALFAMKGAVKYRETPFTEGAFHLPLLPGALVHLECSVYARYPGGDHTIIVGQVEGGSQTTAQDSLQPLLYYARSYGTFAGLSEAKAGYPNSNSSMQKSRQRLILDE